MNSYFHEFLEIGQFVQVFWRDSRLYIEQCDMDDNFDVCTVGSIGAVIKATREMLVLGGDSVDIDGVRRVISIPAENITSIHKLQHEPENGMQTRSFTPPRTGGLTKEPNHETRD